MRLEVTCQDRIGLAKDILTILECFDINLIAIDASNTGLFYLHFADIDFNVLSELMPKIRKVQSVTDVRTVSFMPTEYDHHILQTLFQSLPYAIFSIDNKGRILSVNNAALACVSTPEQDLLGKPVSHWIHGINLNHYLTEMPNIEPHSVTIGKRSYQAEVAPVYQIDETNNEALTAIIICLKNINKPNPTLLREQPSKIEFKQIIAQSNIMKRLISQAQKMAALDAPLLIFGDIGTGKSYFAKACHQNSYRRNKPWLHIHCAEQTSQLFHPQNIVSSIADIKTEADLLSYASGGTIFFDEIANLTTQAQSELLKFLHQSLLNTETGSENNTNIRIICASSKNLMTLIQNGQFSKALYHLLSVLSLPMPPLTERKEDVMPLVEHFMEEYSHQLNKPIRKISATCRKYLINYAWPGNIIQLKNAIYRTVTMSESNTDVTVKQLGLPISDDDLSADKEFDGTLEEAMKQYEAKLLKRLYPSYPSTRLLAKKLGVSHTAVANKLREYKITKT